MDEKPDLKDVLVRALQDVGPVSAAMLLEAAGWQGWSARDFSLAFNRALERGEIRLDADMKLEAASLTSSQAT